MCAPGSGFKKGDVVAVEAESLQHTPLPSPSTSTTTTTTISQSAPKSRNGSGAGGGANSCHDDTTTTAPHESPSPSALRGLVSYPADLTILDAGSSYREGAVPCARAFALLQAAAVLLTRGRFDRQAHIKRPLHPRAPSCAGHRH